MGKRLVFASIIGLIIVLSACSNETKDVSDDFRDETVQLMYYIDEKAYGAKHKEWNNLFYGLELDSSELTDGEQQIKTELLNLASIAEKIPISNSNEKIIEEYNGVREKIRLQLGEPTLKNGDLDEEKIENLIGKYTKIAEAKKREETNDRIQEEMAKRKEIERIKNSNPTIGMTKEEVEMSLWGKPKKINRTVNQYGVKEQWVYPNYKYLYFEDGILTSFQD